MDEPREAGFDEVERGPEAEDREAGTEPQGAPPELLHPSVSALQERFPEAFLHHEVQAGDEHVVFVDPLRNVEVLRWLREDPEQHFDFLADVTAVDYGGGRPIQVVYQLWSIPLRRALRVKCELPLSALEIQSVVPIWQAANWLEREVYDMFGVHFRGHPDLRRILMPESYAEGHPLRKDFPLRGRFSREEQTRRALSQEPGDHYLPTEFGPGREPQIVAGHRGGRPDRGAPTRHAGGTVPPPMGTGPGDPAPPAGEPGSTAHSPGGKKAGPEREPEGGEGSSAGDEGPEREGKGGSGERT